MARNKFASTFVQVSLNFVVLAKLSLTAKTKLQIKNKRVQSFHYVLMHFFAKFHTSKIYLARVIPKTNGQPYNFFADLWVI